jgi:hypothetical protein
VDEIVEFNDESFLEVQTAYNAVFFEVFVRLAGKFPPKYSSKINLEEEYLLNPKIQ